MGKAARFACILLPMLVTVASLVCGLVILLAGTNRRIAGLNSLYLVKLDTRHIATPSSLDFLPGNLDKGIAKTGMDEDTAKELDLSDFYATYLWNYCEGKIDDGSWDWEGCTKPGMSYAFNIEKIIDEESGVEKKIVFPDSVKQVQKGINIVSKFMVACYIMGFVATDVTFLVGWFGLLSRWGSCVTTIFASASFLLMLVASSCSTFLAYGLKGAFNKALDEFGVTATVGKNFQMATWIGTAAALVASLFWLMSTCCCSGKTSKVMDKKGKAKGRGTKVERAPYTYERVASPYMGTSGGTGVPMEPYGAKPGFEPMRHA